MESTGQDQNSQSGYPAETLQQSDSLSSGPDHATNKPTRPQIHKMTYTYVHYKPIAVTAANFKTAQSLSEGSSSQEMDKDPLQDPAKEEDAPAKRTNPAFWFINRRCNRPIMLFGNQMFNLVDELPKAYQAYHRGDTGYRFVLSENKDNLTTLEVSLYKDKTYLFMKKYFKARRASQLPTSFQDMDENAWIPTKSFASFDPVHDHPQDLLDFVLTCCH